MSIRERVIKYLDFKGITKYQFYKETGFSNGFLDKPGTIGADKCEKIIYLYSDINLNWLVTGNGEMLKNQTTNKQVIKNDINYIPLVSIEAVAGFGSTSWSIEAKDIQEKYLVPDFEGIDFMISVKGSSMYPKYNSGDVVGCRIIRESKFIQWNKTYVIATKEQGIMVKRLHPSDDDTSLKAISDNPEYPPFYIPKDEITGIALIIGVIRLE